MNPRRLDEIQPRYVVLGLAGALVIGIAAAYVGAFKGDMGELVRLRSLRVASEQAMSESGGESGAVALERERAAIAALESRLYGKSPGIRATDMVSHIIRQLDGISRRHGASLVSVKPGTEGEILDFAEIPFDVEAEGEYFGLIDWLRDAEAELRPMVVKQFHLRPAPQGEALHMTLRVVSYRVPRRFQ